MLEKTNNENVPGEIIDALLTLYKKGEFEDILVRSSQIIKHYPDTPFIHEIVGAVFFEKGKKAIAAEHFKKVTKLQPTEPHAHNNLGVALTDLEEYNEAQINL